MIVRPFAQGLAVGCGSVLSVLMTAASTSADLVAEAQVYVTDGSTESQENDVIVATVQDSLILLR